MGHSGHGPLDLTMGQQWVGPDGAHVGFEWASPSPCESHGPTVAHGNPRRDLDGLAIWVGPEDAHRVSSSLLIVGQSSLWANLGLPTVSGCVRVCLS